MGGSAISTNETCGPSGFNRPFGIALPGIAVDRSSGPNRGTVYVTWPEAVNYFDDELGGAGIGSEIEGNDVPAGATKFTPGVTLAGNLASESDEDWFSFRGKAGKTVEFLLSPAKGSSADGFLLLNCRNGEFESTVALSYLGGGTALVLFTLPSDGSTSCAWGCQGAPMGASWFLQARTFATSSTLRAMPATSCSRASAARDGIHWSPRQRVER